MTTGRIVYDPADGYDVDTTLDRFPDCLYGFSAWSYYKPMVHKLTTAAD